MKNKTNTRTGGNAGTGAKAPKHKDKDKILPEFPKKKPENLDLNNVASVPENPQPTTSKGGGNAPKIEQVKRYLEARYKFRYNTVKNAVEFADKKGGEWGEVDERTANKLEAELLFANFTGIQRILHVYLSNAELYDPIRAYLDTLPDWDGQTDHIETLANFVKVDQSRRTWFNWMLKKHLVRIVACATAQIAFNKHCFALVGGQNNGKTSYLRYFCPPAWKEYYTEDIDFENKDGLITLARNIFINLDELHNLSRQDINKVKSFITKDSIKARLPFDRRETKLKRNASFFASTNNPEFLTDETGNVRWLVFEIQGINHDNGGQNGYCQVDINLVWAQAYTLLKQGFYCQLTREEIEKSEAHNQAHTKRPIEYDLILKHYDFTEDKADFKTPSEILTYLESKTTQRLNAINVGKAMKMLRRERQRAKRNGNNTYGYYLKESAGNDWEFDD